MGDAGWDAVRTELERAADAGKRVRFWLRDDDAVAPTPALERLDRICAEAAMPVLLAVIPAGATAELGGWVTGHPGFTPCQHGYAHRNHAPAGARACELGGGRSLETVADELKRGRQRLEALFGNRLAPILVPPWNRIDPALVPHLTGLGFERLSTFGPPEAAEDGIPRLNADLDIIDWRNGRVGRSSADVTGKLAALVSAARRSRRPIGILTHHLAHDETAWGVAEEMLTRLRAHPASLFAPAAVLP